MIQLDYIFLAALLIGVFAWWLFREKEYSQRDLVSFGNYLLSKERFDRVKQSREDAFEERYGQVSSADLDNWADKQL